jgi:hypothetical protein
MGMYDPLNRFLSESGKDTVKMSFTEIERLLGRSLPQSAYTYNAWWANGGHSQAGAWLNAGYKVSGIDFPGREVTFIKAGTTQSNKVPVPNAIKPQKPVPAQTATFVNTGAKTMQVCGYTFSYLQDLIPDCDTAGKVIKYYPQNDYDNKKGLPLSYHGKGAFCRFSIQADDWPGVYLWVIDGQIIYIGETAGLRQRFNMGYGNISPRNCYIGGQSTNCKMNKVVLGNFERGKTVGLYFYQTTDYKRVEMDLLNQIYTPYNVKDN